MRKTLIIFVILQTISTYKLLHAGEYDCHPDCSVYCDQVCHSSEFEEAVDEQYDFFRKLSILTGEPPCISWENFLADAIKSCLSECLHSCQECEKDHDKNKMGCFISQLEERKWISQ